MNKLRVVIALGNKVFQHRQQNSAELQPFIAIGEAIARFSQKYELVLVHGDNRQLEDLLSNAENSAQNNSATLATTIAMVQGQTGYLLSQSIENALAKSKHRRKVASLITQVVVDRKDPAFRHPSRPIGRFYTAKEAVRLAKLKGWEMREDTQHHYRRVVPSPEPLDFAEKQSISTLFEAGAIVIAAGSGGVPVVRTKILKTLKGVEAVVDQDLAAERLAELLKADLFVSVTDVPNVYLNYGQPDQITLGFISPAEINAYARQGHFAETTMLPKIQAAAKFASKRKTSIITSLDHLELALTRRSGTIIQ